MAPQTQETTVVRIDTALTLETVPGMKRALEPLLWRPGNIVLDLRGVTLDPAGLGLLLSLKRHLEVLGRELRLVTQEPTMFRLLERAGVPNSLNLFPDLDQAVSTDPAIAGQPLAA